MYGKVEIVAKMPTGDWIWPAMWFLPEHDEYGNWPLSGEIDLVESRGNPVSCKAGGVNTFGSTLHMGPDWRNDNWEPFHAEYTNPTSLGDEFHTYGLIWTEDRIQTYFDEPTNLVLDIDMSKESNFNRGGWNPSKFFNPW